VSLDGVYGLIEHLFRQSHRIQHLYLGGIQTGFHLFEPGEQVMPLE
jgi:hypothetical protein